jgi:hypothetical protein
MNGWFLNVSDISSWLISMGFLVLLNADFAILNDIGEIGIESADGFNAVALEDCEQVSHAGIWLSVEARPPATPESPSGTLQCALSLQVFHPHIRAVVLISVALHSQASSACSLDNEVDSIATCGDLWQDAVACCIQTVKNLSLEV